MKLFRFVSFAISLFVLTNCSTAQTVRVPANIPTDSLVIVATTDFHGSLDKAEGLAQVIRDLRTRFGNRMIYLDGGDLFQGSLEANMSKGRSVVEFFNLLGLDAAAIGNHELDYGPDVSGRVVVKPGEDGLGNLKARAAEAKYKWLSANLVDRHTKTPLFDAVAVFERNQKKVCVIGATTPSTQFITNPSFIRNAAFEDLVSTVKTEADAFRKEQGCQFIILMSHAGLMCNSEGRCLEKGDRAEILELLNKLPAGTLDAVVAGHTHLKAQEVINGTPVIEAGSYGNVVGVLHLQTNKQGHTFEPFISIPAQAEQPDVTALLKKYRDAAAAIKKREVGKTTAPLKRFYYGENPVANLVADSVKNSGKEVLDAEFALINAGGLRFDLPEGTLTYGDVFKVLPFDNSLAVVELKGSELRRLLEISTSGGHGVGGVSGLRIKRLQVEPGVHGVWDRDLNQDGKFEDWERNLIVDVTDDLGNKISDQKMYKLATLDFLVLGGDHEGIVYDSIPAKRKHFFSGIWARDMFIELLKKYPEISMKDVVDPNHPRIEMVPVK